MAQGDYAWRNKWIVNRMVRSEGEKIHLSIHTHTLYTFRAISYRV